MNGAPSVDVGGVVFSYAEIRTGTRAIRIWTAGQGERTYKLDPDPHRDGGYEGNEPKFYQQLATAIGEAFAAGGGWPAYGAQVYVKQTKTDYTLTER
ncbi:hypothetical protein [Cellulomonas fimi]|uniref:Uncharacterized protein n=1 Tax=Cellulomonas fimi (strain ATCC 484 / DSM 20113 / JCM 1341 / CCUG 24087 / LMG 16345 / NBRC 15513 / NCIMB 8980 / NCTC 7547 / NRS-133) TaxID=590998 RepID=F4H3U0_CELFA|nr:hypothetical protein [Cellulomonas fimi]AEE44164.1 hypothetical protein Celf_0012 [Cellulomonas fimi ATCC 484]NNH07571.1 hypothetical protein [Cellulomonas fimi]VEH25795.1 Uncharacterised protein [Cellulomonas fimi]